MTKQEKRALVEECRKSGRTAKEWCESRGIKYKQYTDWASQINKEDRALSEKPIQWAEITSTTKTIEREQKEESEIKLLRGKWIITVRPNFSPTFLTEILKVVDSLC